MPTESELIVKGFVIGLSVAAPVGPMALLCIRRTLQFGRLAGLAFGAGVATADATYAAIAAFGLTAVSDFLVDHQTPLRFAGGLFLVYLGIRALRQASNQPQPVDGEVEAGNVAAFVAAVGLTLTNPLTILSFAAIFSGFGTATTESPLHAALLPLSVFAGSLAWWLFLTTVVSKFRGRISASTFAWLNRIAGGIIVAFGVIAILAAA